MLAAVAAGSRRAVSTAVYIESGAKRVFARALDWPGWCRAGREAAPSAWAPVAPKGWPQRYGARRIAWHVLDHAWEIEDLSDAG